MSMDSKDLRISTEIINEDYPDGTKAVFKITRIFGIEDSGMETPIKFSVKVELIKPNEKNKEVA